MMDGYEKRLIAEYFSTWRDCDALEYAIENPQEFKTKVGENQLELIKTQYDLKVKLKEVLELRVKDLGLDNRFDEFHRNNEDLFGDPYEELMLNRESVLEKAYHDCMVEMYRKSQPSASYDEYVKMYKAGVLRDDDHDRVYNRHYLSREEYEYILDKYVDAYGMSERWNDYVDTVKRYFGDESPNDTWVPEKVDEDGFKHPGYRGYEYLPHFSKVIEGIIKDMVAKNEWDIEKVSMAIYDAVINRIETCQRFYKFDREESGFHVSVGLGASPTCNKDAVINYWKEKGVDIEIVDRNPDTFWEKDYYGSDYESEYADVEYNEVDDEENKKTEQC